MPRHLAFHIPEPLEGVEVHPAFFFRYPPPASSNLFQERVPESYFASVETVGLDAADAIILPNNFKRTDGHIDAYIRSYADEAQARGITLFIFACGDFTEHLAFDPRARVFRYSLYRSEMKAQDICMPTVTEDLGAGGITYRAKADMPTVSFCGKAGFPTLRSRIAYHLKNAALDLRSITRPILLARKVGIFWRRRAIAVCRRSSHVRSRFIIRSSFSGNRKTIELDPGQARREFLDSVIESDFVLAPKGDGNYSNRFLEALSLGRVPVLIDTDVVLPLEDEIDYDRCIVRVPMGNIDRLPEIVRAWYDSYTESEWVAAQAHARTIYQNYLRIDSFFARFFADSNTAG